MSSSWGDDEEEMEFETSAISYSKPESSSVKTKDAVPSSSPPSSSPPTNHQQYRNNNRSDNRNDNRSDSRYDNRNSRGGFRGGHNGPRRDYNAAPVPLPTAAPFKASFTNVAYEASDLDFDKLLENYQIARKINISRGSKHVEFTSLDELKRALAEFNNFSFMGRPLSVTVCPPPSNVSNAYNNNTIPSGRVAYNQNYTQSQPRASPPTVQSTSSSNTPLEPLKIERKTNKPNPFGDAKPREEVLKERVTSQPSAVSNSQQLSPTAAASESKATGNQSAQESNVQDEAKPVQEKKEKTKKSKNKSGGGTPKPKEVAPIVLISIT